MDIIENKDYEQFLKDFKKFYGVSFYEYIKFDIESLKNLGVHYKVKNDNK